MDDTLVILYCLVDEFCKEFYPEWEKTLIAPSERRPSGNETGHPSPCFALSLGASMSDSVGRPRPPCVRSILQ